MTIFLISISVVIGGLYIIADSPIEKLFILAMVVFVLVPILINLLSFVIKNLNKSLKEYDQKNPYSRQVDKNGNIMLKSELEKSQKTFRTVSGHSQCTSNSQNTQLSKEYSDVRNLIISCSKSKQLSRQTILELKAMLRNILNTHYEPYSHMTFTNDLHEIYVLLKSRHLSSADYLCVYDFISKATQQRD